MIIPLLIGAYVVIGTLFVIALCRAAALGDRQLDEARRRRDR